MPTPQPKLNQRCFSLVSAWRQILTESGDPQQFDDLAAALGLSLMSCAHPVEDPARWSGYARDVFLVPAARLYGITLRGLHPPEAAVGIDREDSFEQHFEASYRPLIAAALNNRQSVLAWRGWAQRCELDWGLITECHPDRLSGIVFDAENRPVISDLSNPPVQVYIAETTSHCRPDSTQLWQQFVRNGRAVLANGCNLPGGLITGPHALRFWLERAAEFAPERRLVWINDLIEQHSAALRFVQRISEDVEGARPIAESLQRVIISLEQLPVGKENDAETAFEQLARHFATQAAKVALHGAP